MNGIPEATPIILTEAERTELEALARSTKTEYRLRQRARIVLGAAEGVGSRAIGREGGWGYHFLPSMTPIEEITPTQFVERLPEGAKRDLMEWNSGITIEKMAENI